MPTADTTHNHVDNKTFHSVTQLQPIKIIYATEVYKKVFAERVQGFQKLIVFENRVLFQQKQNLTKTKSKHKTKEKTHTAHAISNSLTRASVCVCVCVCVRACVRACVCVCLSLFHFVPRSLAL